MDIKEKIAEIIKTVATQAVMICPATPDEDYYADQIMSLIPDCNVFRRINLDTMEATELLKLHCPLLKSEGWVSPDDCERCAEIHLNIKKVKE